jgi:DNA (cytosine-5)-methyltransferase 1
MTLTAIDLFAGLGGFTEGATNANANVVWAANHWHLAVVWHARNHPGTAHLCQDLHQADWTAVPSHDLLLASPACQGHSPARGKERPHHDATRSTAWAVVSCAEVHRPYAAVIENVPAFMKWPLYPAWSMAMEAIGYKLSPHVLDAADYGVPQNRRRLIIIATRSRFPFLLRPHTAEHQPIAPIIQWDRGPWRKIDRTLAPATLQRIRNGRRAFGARFLAPYYSSGSGLTGRSIDRPIGTLTTKDRWAVIDGGHMRMLNVEESRAAMGFRPTYQLPAQQTLAKQMLGNAVPPPMVTEIISELAA